MRVRMGGRDPARTVRPRGPHEDSPYAKSTKKDGPRYACVVWARMCGGGGVICVEKGTHNRCGVVSAKIKHGRHGSAITCGKSLKICC